jgi:ribosomal protein L12E/L44/L45/RPP1/RPP2
MRKRFLLGIKGVLLVVALLAVVLTAACAAGAGVNSGASETDASDPVAAEGAEDAEEGESGEDAENDPDEEDMPLYFDGGELPEVIMRINGQDILAEQLLEEYAQMEVLYKSVGIDVDAHDVRYVMEHTLLSNTISTVLLEQEADKAGVVVTDQQVADKAREVREQYASEAEFEKMLSDLNLTPETMEEEIRKQLKTSKFFEENLDQLLSTNSELSFSEEEKQQMYEMFSERVGGGMPGYDDVRGEVDDILEESKVEVLLSDYIQKLTDESEIELFLE